jgi:hypothetical protein
MARPRRSTGKLTAPPDTESGQHVAKHRRIFDRLFASIQSGELRPGDRLPSEAELGKLFAASRITVAKAVLDLQRMGLVSRRPGAGTHVLGQHQTTGRTFGLLIPELGPRHDAQFVCAPRCFVVEQCLYVCARHRERGRTTCTVLHSAKGRRGILCAAGIDTGKRFCESPDRAVSWTGTNSARAPGPVLHAVSRAFGS